MNDTTFKWGNYLKPSPANLQYLSTAIKGILAVLAGTALASDHPYMATYILIGGAVLDELSKFFAKVNDDAMKTVTVKFPEKLADQVEVTETVEDPKKPE